LWSYENGSDLETGHEVAASEFIRSIALIIGLKHIGVISHSKRYRKASTKFSIWGTRNKKNGLNGVQLTLFGVGCILLLYAK
jgi:hypothetical protein